MPSGTAEYATAPRLFRIRSTVGSGVTPTSPGTTARLQNPMKVRPPVAIHRS